VFSLFNDILLGPSSLLLGANPCQDCDVPGRGSVSCSPSQETPIKIFSGSLPVIS